MNIARGNINKEKEIIYITFISGDNKFILLDKLIIIGNVIICENADTKNI